MFHYKLFHFVLLLWNELKEANAPHDIIGQSEKAYSETLKLKYIFKYYKNQENDN